MAVPDSLFVSWLGSKPFFKRTAWVLFGVLLLWLVAWAGLPWLIKQQIEQRGSAFLGRQVSIGSVVFEPWRLALTLNQVAVAHAHQASTSAGDEGPVPERSQLYIERVTADADLSSVWLMAPVMDEVTLIGPRLQLRHFADGRLDVDDLLLRLAPPPARTPSEPARFALHNLSVLDGGVTLKDDAVARVHVLSDLRLTLPFLSNVPADRQVNVLPHLGFALNGARFDTRAQALPFADSRKTQAHLKVADLDMAPYLPYLNPLLPVALHSCVLGLDLQLAFEQTPHPQVKLSGQVNLTKAHLSSRQAGADLAVERLSVDVSDFRPLDRVMAVNAIKVHAPVFTAERRSDGLMPWLTLPASSPEPVDPTGVKPWRGALKHLALTEGVVRWRDAAVSPAYRAELRRITLQAREVAWPATTTAPVEVAAEWAAGGQQAPLSVEGVVGERQAQLTAKVSGFSLVSVSPYLASRLRPSMEGRLSGTTRLAWSQPLGQTPTLDVSVDTLTLDAWRLGGRDAAPLARAEQLSVSGARIDLAKQQVDVASIQLRSPGATVVRNSDGQWMFEQWLVPEGRPPVPTGRAAALTTPASVNKALPPWRVAVQALAVQGGNLTFTDQAAPRPVSLDMRALDLTVKNLAWPTAQTADVVLSARLGAGALEPGSLGLQGALGLQPLAFQGRIQARRLPAHALAPYAAGKLRMDLQRADASYAGTVAFQALGDGPVLKLVGDVSVEDVRANTLGGVAGAATAPVRSGPASALIATPRGGLRVGNELLSWKTFSLRGVEVHMAPQARTRVNIGEAVLSDFFVRLLIRENGRINLQDLLVSDATERPAGDQSARAASPWITVGPLSLVNGSMYFSDRFIQPNYAADLTELTGRLGGFTSESKADGAVALADLVLRGRAEGTASLDIAGQLNPLANPLALNIQGKVRDLELPPLSPYAIKYAGHGIEKGKLSLDVGYEIKPDGHLSATNRLVLNQLTFGDKVDGAQASLPVKLAVALLADRHGVIDLDLPITGSLNDPHFSLGSVIFKVIGNVIGKALTAPFSLLGKAFSGIAHSAETTVVSFWPGSSRLTPESREQLVHTAQALLDKPNLHLTISGAANLDAERESVQQERLASQLRAERRRQALSKGQALPADEGAAFTAEERATLLREVYKRADIPKPRNLLGMVKELPLSDIESLLLANLPASDQGIRQLAQQRAVAVRDTLLGLNVPADQLFLGPVKTDAGQDKWVPRAELGLGMR